MFVFPFWRRLITAEHQDRNTEIHDARVAEHLVSLRDHYVPGMAHYWR